MCSQPLARSLHGVAHFNGFIQRCSQACHLPGKEGLMHISEYEWGHPATLEGLIQEGDEFQVKVIAFDDKTGKIKLSRKALLPKPEGYEEEKSSRGDRGGHGPRREGGDCGGNGGERRSSGNGGGRRR